MQITWYGHSCFLLTAEDGYKILTDPCGQETGYMLHDIVCDTVTVSHDHSDHNCLSGISGSPQVIRTVDAHQAGDIAISGYATFHDGEQGAKRGDNIIFLYEIDGLRLLHLGDLGHMLSDEMIEKIGPVDVLFAPIGGVFTIDAVVATELADKLGTRVFIPMHYKTPALHFDVEGLEPLLDANEGRSIHHVNENTCTLTKDSLGECRLLILDYKR